VDGGDDRGMGGRNRGHGVERDRAVGGARVDCVAIRVRIDGHGLDAELFASAHHAHSDLAAVGDEHTTDLA